MTQRIALHPNAIERNVFRIAGDTKTTEPEWKARKGQQHFDATDLFAVHWWVRKVRYLF